MTNHFLKPSEDMDEQPSFLVVEEANAHHLQFFELLRSTSVHDYVSVGDIIHKLKCIWKIAQTTLNCPCTHELLVVKFEKLDPEVNLLKIHCLNIIIGLSMVL